MAHPEHLQIFEKGVEAWNSWRKDNPTDWPNLTGIVAVDRNLNGINLENTNMHDSRLTGSLLRQANLRNVNLRGAILSRTDLQRANLEEANLYSAVLTEANMEWTNLRHANLLKARFDRTRVGYSTFVGTSFDYGLIEGGLGLGTVFHAGASIIDTRLFESAARSFRRESPRHRATRWFLQSAGLPPRLTSFIEELSPESNWYSCFVSYSHEDKEFTGDSAPLSSRGIPYWRDEASVGGGSVLIEETASAIIFHDRMLLCCSHKAWASSWVDQEIKVALEKERQLGWPEVLIPLDIDGCLIGTPGRKEELAQRLGAERLVADFTEWRNEKKFASAFERLTWVLRTGL